MTSQSSECLFCGMPCDGEFCNMACREAWWLDGEDPQNGTKVKWN